MNLKFFTIIIFITLISINVYSQGIEITVGARLECSGDATIEINNGSLINNGDYVKGAETVIFTGNISNTISGTSNTSINNLEINNSAGITSLVPLLTAVNLNIRNDGIFIINPAMNLTVTGIMENSAGATGLILKSDDSGTASIISGTSGVEATVERYLSGNEWLLLFAPLSGIPVSTFTAEGHDMNKNLYSYTENTADYWSANSTFGVTGWTPEYSNSNLTTSKGLIYNRYNLSSKTFILTGGTLFTGQKEFELSYTKNSGEMANGVTQGWENFDGWNLVGNPYSSAIDWDLVPKDDIDAGIYFYDGDNYQYYVYGEGNSPWDVGITLNGGSKYIPSGQGFFVKVKNTGISHIAHLTLTDGARVHSSQHFWKSLKTTSPNILKIKLFSDSVADETVIRTVPGVTEGFDSNYDALKMFSWNSSRLQLYSMIPGKDGNYAINTLPEVDESYSLPLGIKYGNQENYNLTIVENTFDNYFLWLEDKTSGKMQNLNVDKSYTFSQLAGNSTNRFILHICKNHPPEAGKISDQEVKQNQLFDFEIPPITFTDPDTSDVLNYIARLEDGNLLPAWLKFDNKTLKFSGLPDKTGNLKVKITAIDLLGKTASAVFNLEVKELNIAPISSAINNQTGYFNRIFSFLIPKGTFSDPDPGDSLVFTAKLSDGNDLPYWLSFDELQCRFYGLPDAEERYEILVVATDLHGASTSTKFNIDILMEPLSVEIQEEPLLQVYPNPTYGLINIKSTVLSNARISVSDLSGKVILEKEISSPIETIDLTGKGEGYYLVRLKTDSHQLVKKVEVK